MNGRCPRCGHDLHGHHEKASTAIGSAAESYGGIVPDIGVGDAMNEPNGFQSRRSRPTRTGIRPAAIAGLLLAALVLGLVIWFIRDSGSEAADGLPTDTTPTEQGVNGEPDESEELTGTGAVGGDSQEARRGDPNLPPSDAHIASDTIADLFRRRINDGRDYMVVYPSPMGLQTLSAQGAIVPEIEVAVGFEEATRFPLLNDGDTTWGINPSDPNLAYLVSTQFVVVDISREGSVAFINGSRTPTNVGVSSFGAWGPGFDVPIGSEILAVSGRGLLIAPATGGTFRLVANKAELISDDRVIAAGLHSEVYQRCDEQLICELYVVGPSHPEGIDIELDATGPVYVSPEGDYVLAVTSDGAVLVTVESGDRWNVSDDVVFGAGWAPGGAFVALAAGNEMMLAFPETQRIERATLPIIPASAHLLVVAD